MEETSECIESAKQPFLTEKSSNNFALHHAIWQCMWPSPTALSLTV